MRDALVFLSASEDAVEVYEAQRESLQAAGLQPRTSTPPQAPHLGSAPLQQVRRYSGLKCFCIFRFKCEHAVSQ